jgi:hypothetical protein
MRLKPEGGVTQISLENALQLIEEKGPPDLVQLINEGKNTSEHAVVATWGDFSHTFTGFSWGYGGEGPNGLAKFFRMVGLQHRIPTCVIGKLPQNKPGLLLSFARSGWLIEYAYDEAKEVDESLEKVEGPVEMPESD